jgi:alpha-galactosidase
VRLVNTGEDGINQVKALLGLGNFVSNVNLPNRGQHSGLPMDCVVETNALFTRDNIAPVYAGCLPHDINAMVSMHCFNMEGILEAAMNRDKELAFRVFMNDPLVTTSVDDGRRLFDTMLKNTKDFLPGWDI